MSRGDGPSLPIDVRIPGVGRVKKRSGVRTAAERNDLVAMLRTLPKQGHLELVRDIQAGRRKPLDVYAHYVARSLDQLAGPQDDAPLTPALGDWLDHALCAAGTRENRRAAFRALQCDGRRAYRFGDLPMMLRDYRGRCEVAGYPRAFNIAKTCVQAFVRDKVGPRKKLTLDVADVPKLTERKRGRQGLALADAVAVRDGLGPNAGRIWWSMVITGMGPKELWGAWTVQQDRVHIAGTKTEGRVRDVPLVDTPVRPELTRPGFVSALRRYSEQVGTVVAPYQARKSFARWMEEARIPRTRRLRYMGHGRADVTDRYEDYEVTTFLREDAERMRDTLRAVLPRQGLRVEA